MSAPWLTLIGIGEDGSFSAAARSALETAEIVYGSARHFDLVPAPSGKVRLWPSPFSKVFDDLAALKGRSVAVLATGDPQWYGIGSSLARYFRPSELMVFPAPSAFQLAAARLGWTVQDCECLSVHGRPADMLRCQLYPGARLLVLTSNGKAPKEIAGLLIAEGYGTSRMTALEHLGGDREKIISGVAQDWTGTVADFHTLAVEVIPDSGTLVRARTPGLPDDAFRHDGKMTKQEVRAITLAALQPYPGALLWDIGSGCGSVAIEWLRAANRTKAIGLEPHEDRRRMAAENAISLGVPHLDLIDATAPGGLQDLPPPDAIFIGGGLTASGMIESCLSALKSGGVLVANAVTLESEAVLLNAYQAQCGDLKRLSVQRASAVGGLTGWRPAMPVTQWSYVKP